MNRGVSLMGQYEYAEAVKAFEEVLRAEPNLSEAKVNLAIARFNRANKDERDLDLAGEILDQVLKGEPENVRAWYFKGIVLQHVGQSEPAIACFEKVVQLRPDDGVSWYLLGMCKQRLGQKAERELLRAIELRPYLGSAYYKLWQTLQAEGQTDQAAPYLEKFKQLRENPLNETIELPQYNYMGELALVRPLPARNTPPITRAAWAPQPARTVWSAPAPGPSEPASAAPGAPAVGGPLSGAAVADFNRDGRLDLAFPAPGTGRLVLLLRQADGSYTNATAGSGWEGLRGVSSVAAGDFDNDEAPDLYVTAASGSRLLRGKGDGTFVDVTAASGVTPPVAGARSALWLDADHDGDLELFVCGPPPAGNQLWSNNGDGVFTNIAVSAGIACADATNVLVLAGDLDGDRDADLVVLRAGQPAKLFLNELLGKYREADLGGLSIAGDLGGVLQDFNGDGRLDLLVLGGTPARLRLYPGDGHAHFQPDPAFAQTVDAAATWGAARGFRCVDLDADGDLDILLFADDAHALLNDGAGRFVLQPRFWKGASPLAGAEWCDLTGDGVADLFCLESGAVPRAVLLGGQLSPPSTTLSLAPSGMRGRDKRTRSPASGFGALLTVRADLKEQIRVVSGQAGGFSQADAPTVLGLGGADKADYVHILWPDGVAQVEVALAANQPHKISELQRKTSSCPVLFTWNGTRFECVTDFAGVGGLGYFVAPGEYAPPQALEYLKIEPEQLRPRERAYELRITEPMEEVAYVDRLELIAIDHPREWRVFPDERLAVSGQAPTHELLAVDQAIFPVAARDPQGRDCTDALRRVDRVYAYSPELDRRFFGFCRPHTLELDFGDRLALAHTNQHWYLFLSGYLEYPYSQTAYAASQARVGWQPIKIERQTPAGRWETVVPDAGAFGGLARTMTVDLTGLIGGPSCRLRLTSNLELYYDQVFVARHAGLDRVRVHKLPVMSAELRRGGFAREYSPDGRFPLLYDYELTDASAPFHVPRGAYTRFGAVTELLSDYDDRYVVFGPGEEIAVRFDAQAPGPPPEGMQRSFVLVSHSYCKDMDLYTGTPQTVEPLPFRAMSRYPYPPSERYPDTAATRQYRQTFNTRTVQ